MQTRKLLSDLKQKVNEKIHQINFAESKDNNLEAYAKKLEQEYSIKTLQQLLEVCEVNEDKPHASELKSFQEFLAKRWERIRGTNLSYPHAPQEMINKLCVKLAEILQNSGALQIDLYKLLMPTLMTAGAGLKLHEFILSDDDKEIIEVAKCIEDTFNNATKRQTLKKILSETEKSRLMNHSPEAKEFYDALQELNHLKMDGETFAATLKRLWQGLENGSTKHGNFFREFNAGPIANESIVDFYNFRATLTEKELDLIDKHTYSPEYLCTFGDLWKLLTAPKITKGDEELEPRFCVSSISDKLKSVIENNAWLDDIFPFHLKQATLVCVECVTHKIENAKDAWISAMKNGNRNYHVYAVYKNHEERLPKQVFGNLWEWIADKKTYFKNLSKEERESLNKMINKRKAASLSQNLGLFGGKDREKTQENTSVIPAQAGIHRDISG